MYFCMFVRALASVSQTCLHDKSIFETTTTMKERRLNMQLTVDRRHNHNHHQIVLWSKS